ncbi:MAG: NADP-reducing hydrogenase subunit HndC [Syntrophorhabdaceae bacterium PtaU1.Bin034]|jgi:NADH:ubiquinone oxidoreductase subunit F (NADH-binding)/(2Fe-2S) ferredoxin|nr:MAG: NADP-reducing hydrogenase subunit HndC [Syntrophorhabdaceae bacterium PtaU1.Bin034]
MNIVRSHVLISMDAGTIMAGARAVQAELVQEINKKGLAGEVAVLETGSLGVTGQGVVLVVYPEGLYYANVTKEDVAELVEEHLLKGRLVKRLLLTQAPKRFVIKREKTGLLKEQPRVVLANCGLINPESIEEYIAEGGYEGASKALTKMTPEEVINEIKSSGLAGRGGAAFPTGMKWEFARKVPGDEKYIICNADEGEPGTFKDRLILEGDPHKLLEGMIIAAYAIGATQGFIYIRGEYTLSIERTEKAIADARSFGLLGNTIFDKPFAFDIVVMKGAGAYVCGEETALIESLEGHRGHPRNKPPYPVVAGLWDKPTVVNNVETLANIADIVKNGANWFRKYGTTKCAGTKVYTILGHVATPGLIETEMGTTLRDIIYEYGGGISDGKQFKGALVGGAAGAFLGPDMLDVQMDFVNLKEYAAALGSGAILVMNEDTSMRDMLANVLHFFKHESCGHCVPCRLGTARLVEIMDRVAASKGTSDDVNELLDIAAVMKDTSFCPLGQSLYLPISSCLKYFRDEIVGS